MFAGTTQEKSDDSQYVLTLLAHGLIELSQDMAIISDIDPDYLITKALLTSALKLNAVGTKEALISLEERFPWLMDLLTENLEVDK